METLLAQITAGDQSWNVVLALGVLSGLAVSITTLFRQGKTQCRQIEPQPLRVELAKEFVTRSEMESLAHELRAHDEKRQAIYARMEQTRLELKTDINKVHERIDGLPDRIIATLRNTGALRTPHD